MLKSFFKTLLIVSVFFFAVQTPTAQAATCSQSNRPSIQTQIRLSPTTIYTNSPYSVITSVKNIGSCDIDINGGGTGAWGGQIQSTSYGNPTISQNAPSVLRSGETYDFINQFYNGNPNQGTLQARPTVGFREDFAAQVLLYSNLGNFDGGRVTTNFTTASAPCTTAEISQVLVPSFTLSSANATAGTTVQLTPTVKNNSSATLAHSCNLATGTHHYQFLVYDNAGNQLGGVGGAADPITSQQTLSIPATTISVGASGVKTVTIRGTWYPSDNVSQAQLQVSAGQTLTVSKTIPTVTVVSPATNLTPISATVNGNITSTGGGTVSERGILYSTTANPFIGSAGAIKVPASGTGTAFSSSLTGLTLSTLYYAKAYAINEMGTAYTLAITFTTPATFRNCTYADKGTFLPTFTLSTTNVATNSSYQVTVTAKNNSQGTGTCIWPASGDHRIWVLEGSTSLYYTELFSKPALNSQETFTVGPFSVPSGTSLTTRNIYVEVSTGWDSAWSDSASQAITFSNPNCAAGQGSITGTLSASPDNFAFTGTGATTNASTITYSANITNGPGCILTAGRTIALSVTWNGATKTKTYTLASNLAQGASLSIPGGSELAFPNNLSLIGVYGASARTATLNGTSAVTLTDASVSAKCPVGNNTSGDCAVDPQVAYGVANNGYTKAGAVMPAGTCGKSACLSIKNISSSGTTWSSTYKFVSSNTAWAAAATLASNVAPGATASVGVDLTAPNTPGATSNTDWSFQNGSTTLSASAFGTQAVKITCATSVTDCAAFVSQTTPPDTARLEAIPFSVVMKNLGSTAWDATYEVVPSDVQAPPVVVNPPTPLFQKAVDGTVGTGTIKIGVQEMGSNGYIYGYSPFISTTEVARRIPKDILNNKAQFTIDFWRKGGAGPLLGDDMYPQQAGGFNVTLDSTPGSSYSGRGQVGTVFTPVYLFQYPQSPGGDMDGIGLTIHEDDQWHHIVITYKQNSLFKIYIDNTLYSSRPTVGNFTLGGNILIGQDKMQGASTCMERQFAGYKYGIATYRMVRVPCTTYQSNYFNGEIDEFKIYDSVLQSSASSVSLAKSSGSTAYNENATFTGSLVAPAVRGSYTFNWKVIKHGGTPSITPNPAGSTPVTIKAGDLTPNVSISSTGFARATEYIYEGDSVTASFTGDASSVGKIVRSSRAASKRFTAPGQTKMFPTTGKYTNVIKSINFSLGTVNLSTTPSTGTSVPVYEIHVCPETQASCP